MADVVLPKHISEHRIKVLLIDDQATIGHSVRLMLQPESDIEFRFCSNPLEALELAKQFEPTVILQDLVMPQVDGLMLVKFFRAALWTKDVPLIVLSSKEEPLTKAEAFARGANDYLVKLPDRLELIARIRYHSKGYINLLERNEAYQQLAASQKHLAAEIDAASKYVQSLLPAPTEEPVRLEWHFLPCAELGGDSFGYHWLDDDHLGIYVLDVTGHGLGSALLSISVMNVMRSRSLPNTNFLIPGEVIGGLNEAFPLDNHGGKCFTIWYGVYNRQTRVLKYAGGGHPSALLYQTPGSNQPEQLESTGPMMGMISWPLFDTLETVVQPGARLYVYSDGVHEIHKADGGEWRFDEFVDFLSQAQQQDAAPGELLLKHVRELSGKQILDDDYSIVEARF
jgi:sigma-B regulation protein RsbU (phosphoserine phosphatase)